MYIWLIIIVICIVLLYFLFQSNINVEKRILHQDKLTNIYKTDIKVSILEINETYKDYINKKITENYAKDEAEDLGYGIIVLPSLQTMTRKEVNEHLNNICSKQTLSERFFRFFIHVNTKPEKIDRHLETNFLNFMRDVSCNSHNNFNSIFDVNFQGKMKSYNRFYNIYFYINVLSEFVSKVDDGIKINMYSFDIFHRLHDIFHKTINGLYVLPYAGLARIVYKNKITNISLVKNKNIFDEQYRMIASTKFNVWIHIKEQYMFKTSQNKILAYEVIEILFGKPKSLDDFLIQEGEKHTKSKVSCIIEHYIYYHKDKYVNVYNCYIENVKIYVLPLDKLLQNNTLLKISEREGRNLKISYITDKEHFNKTEMSLAFNKITSKDNMHVLDDINQKILYCDRESESINYDNALYTWKNYQLISLKK